MPQCTPTQQNSKEKQEKKNKMVIDEFWELEVH
jgi:hypothetical protein